MLPLLLSAIWILSVLIFVRKILIFVRHFWYLSDDFCPFLICPQSLIFLSDSFDICPTTFVRFDTCPQNFDFCPQHLIFVRWILSVLICVRKNLTFVLYLENYSKCESWYFSSIAADLRVTEDHRKCACATGSSAQPEPKVYGGRNLALKTLKP